jgi:hypothetical protein
MILSRVKLNAQQRYDLEDFLASQSAARTDSKFWTKQFLSASNYILKGFSLSGLGLTEAVLTTENGTLINSQSTSDFSWFVIDEATTNITITDAELTNGLRNYVELQLVTESNTPATKAFWDPAASGGVGSEFNQEVDTITDLALNIIVTTGGFSTSPDSLPIGIIDVDGAGNITGIRDKRNLFFRLGTTSDPFYSFNFANRDFEPGIDLTISGVTGTFEAGEEVTFTSGATGTVITGGTTNIVINLLSSDAFIAGDTITGSISTATGTLVNYQESFTGADKDIDDVKDSLDAIMTLIKETHGRNVWYQKPATSIQAMWEVLGLSVLVGATTSAKFAWSGADLVITDESGTPINTDPIAYLRNFTNSADLAFSRETIAINDGQIVYVQLPASGSRTYTGLGSSATNYQVVDRGSVPDNGDTYWLAYREGTKLYVRGLGELEAGETRQVSDETTEAMALFLGFDPETASSVPYTATPDSIIFDNLYDTSSSLVTAISTNTANLNDLGEIIKNNVFEERIIVVDSGAGTNELNGPVAVDTIIDLPVDSRDGNATEFYIVGDGALEVFINGQFVSPLMDGTYQEVGTVGNPSNQIQIKQELAVGDTLVFRIDTAGAIKVIGGGGGLTTLQDAYNNGRSIVVASGQPMEITGPAGEKLLRVVGDVEFTGLVDPMGMTFTREATDPLGAKDGIYVDGNGDLIYKKNGAGSVNLYEAGSGQAVSIALEDLYDNNSGTPLFKGTPIRINTAGTLDTIDVAIENEVDAIVGLTNQDIADGQSGTVVFKGRLKDISTAIIIGSPVYLSKSGIITADKPTEGSNGFLAGDFVVRIGTIIKNVDDPLKKDLLVDIKVLGQL